MPDPTQEPDFADRVLSALGLEPPATRPELSAEEAAEAARAVREQPVRARAYARAALDGMARELAAMPPNSGRNGVLNSAVWQCGQYIGMGLLTEAEVRTDMTAAAHASGLSASETRKTVDSALKGGLTKTDWAPLVLPDRPPPDRTVQRAAGLEFLGALPPPPLELAAGNGHGPPSANGSGPGPPAPPDDPWAEPVDDPELERYASAHLLWALRFARVYADRFLFAHGIGWHRYDGTHWVECRDGGENRALVALIHEEIVERLVPLVAAGDVRGRKAKQKEIDGAQTAGGQAGILHLAATRSALTTTVERLDEDRALVNTPSGTLNLNDGTVRPCRPGDRLTKLTRAAFDPDARSDMFEDFLCQIQPDPEMRAFLARSLGSALLGEVRDHVLLIWHGPGANGKGTLRDAVCHALGDYTAEIPAEVLLVSKQAQQQLAPERMRLRGTRLAFCSEISQNARLDEATMKKLTGGDPVNARLLYRNPIQFEPSHTLFMLTNHLPRVRADDPATWRRILAVPFAVVIPPDQRDLELSKRLRDESNAILAWLWRGWSDYQRQGLAPPEAVRVATGEYQQGSDIVARFLAEESGQVEYGTGFKVRSAVLYGRFGGWCQAEGEEVEMSNKKFTEAVESHGLKRIRSSGGMVWLDVRLSSSAEVDHDREW